VPLRQLTDAIQDTRIARAALESQGLQDNGQPETELNFGG